MTVTEEMLDRRGNFQGLPRDFRRQAYELENAYSQVLCGLLLEYPNDHDRARRAAKTWYEEENYKLLAGLGQPMDDFDPADAADAIAAATERASAIAAPRERTSTKLSDVELADDFELW